MRKLILASFLVACIFALPHKKEPELSFSSLYMNNAPELKEAFHKKIANFKVPAEALDCVSVTNETLLNACADELFSMLDDYLASKCDPWNLPELHGEFDYTLIIHYHGKIDLTGGKVTGLSTLKRYGDIAVHGDLETYVSFSFGTGFDKLGINYDYSAEIMSLSPSGGIEGSVSGLGFTITVRYDIPLKEFSVDEFKIISEGEVKFEFTGNSLVDWLLNLLSDTVSSLLKEVVKYLGEYVEEGLEILIDAINNYLDNQTVGENAASDVSNKLKPASKIIM